MPALFDLAADPAENRNQAAEQPERVASLLAGYRAWERELTTPRWRYRKARKQDGK